MEKNNQPLVSVIMPCYNHESYVASAIESVLNQSYKNIELIVADNGSVDNSYQVIDKYKEQIAIILQLEKNDQRQCLLDLMKAAKGDYIAIMTSDDYWEPNKIELQMKVFQEYLEVKACTTWAVYADENLNQIEDQSQTIFSVKNRSKGQWLKRLIRKGNCFAWPTAVVEADIFRKLMQNRGYRQLADFFFWLQFVQEAEVYVIEEPLAKFRWHVSGNNRNESAPCKENDIRLINEYIDIVDYNFEHMSDEVFLEAFGDEMVNPKAESHEEIMCEKFWVLMKMADDNDYFQPCVFKFYHNNFQQINADEIPTGLGVCLPEKYQYSYQKFSEWCGKSGVGKIYLERNDAVIILSEKLEKKEAYIRDLKGMLIECDNNENSLIRLRRLKKKLYTSLPEEMKKTVELVYQYCNKMIKFFMNTSQLNNQVIMQYMDEFTGSIDFLWDDLKYIEFGLSNEEWNSFKEQLQIVKVRESDLRDLSLQFLKRVQNELQVYFIDEDVC